MFWFFLAGLFLLAGVVNLLYCLVLRRRAAVRQEESSGTQPASAAEKKSKRLLLAGVVCLALTEAAILIGQYAAG